MSWITWLDQFWGGSGTEPGLRSMPGASQMARYNAAVYPEESKMGTQMQTVITSPIVHTAIQLVSETAAAAGLNIYHHPRGKRKTRTPMEEHPFASLVDMPNEIFSGFELREKTHQWLEATGNAYWFYEPDADGKPKEIWALRPDRVAIIPDAKSLIWGYLYSYEGYNVKIPAAQVTHFKRPHPLSDWFGLSALQAAWLDIASDKAMAQFNYQWFGKKVAKVDGMLILPSSLSDDMFDEAKETITADYGNSRGTMVIRASSQGESVDFKQLTVNQKDMEYHVGRNFTRQLVLELMGIPTGMMSEASTEAHARVAERRFLAGIWRRLERMAGRLNVDALPLYGTNLRCEFDDVRVADAEQLKSRMEAMAGHITENEAREELGKAPIPGGDQLPQEKAAQEGADQRQEEQERDPRSAGVKGELAALRRTLLSGSRTFDTFQFRVLGAETQRELQAACAGQDADSINQTILRFYGRQADELVR